MSKATVAATSPRITSRGVSSPKTIPQDGRTSVLRWGQSPHFALMAQTLSVGVGVAGLTDARTAETSVTPFQRNC